VNWRKHHDQIYAAEQSRWRSIPGVNLDYRAELLRLCRVSTEGVTAEEISAYLPLAQRIETAKRRLSWTRGSMRCCWRGSRAQRWNLIVPEILDFLRSFAEAGHGADNE
jgi:hypothetical protein